MANNQYINKVEFGNTTVMDITDTTAVESDVASGKYFYKANGEKVSGSALAPTSITPSNSIPAELVADIPVNPTSSGYAIKRYYENTPSNSDPPVVANNQIVKVGGSGYMIASYNSITPNDYNPPAISNGNIYKALDNGYAIEHQPTTLSPSNSSPQAISSGTNYIANDNGYAIKSYNTVTPDNSNPEYVSPGAIEKFASGGVIIAYLGSATPSDIDPYPLSEDDIVSIADNGYLIESYDDVIPADVNPPYIQGPAILRLGGGYEGYVYETQQSGGSTPITPSNVSPVALTANNPVNPTTNGYAIESYNDVTPSNSNPPALTSGDIDKLGGNGYAIESYTSLSVSQTPSYESPGFYKVSSYFFALSSFSAVTASAGDVLSGKQIYNSSGSLVAGTRPAYFLKNSSKYMYILDQPIQADTSQDVLAFRIKGHPVYLRCNGTTLQLVSMKSDGVTESTVNIATNLTYIQLSVISKVRYIESINTVYFEWRCGTDADNVAKTALNNRAFSLTYDYTLRVGSTYQVSITDTINRYSIGGVIRCLYDDYSAWYYTTMYATGAKAIRSNRSHFYANPGPRIVINTSDSTAELNIGSNVNTYLADQTKCVSKGGLFYTAANGTKSVFIVCSYESTAQKSFTYAAVDSNGDFNTFMSNFTDNYILGYMKCGLLLIASYDGDFYFTAWEHDPVATTDCLIAASAVYGSIPSIACSTGEAIISFENDVIITSLGKRYQIVYDTTYYELEIVELPQITNISHVAVLPENISMGKAGPASDPFNGVFIYGD